MTCRLARLTRSMADLMPASPSSSMDAPLKMVTVAVMATPGRPLGVVVVCADRLQYAPQAGDCTLFAVHRYRIGND